LLDVGDGEGCNWCGEQDHRHMLPPGTDRAPDCKQEEHSWNGGTET
jgi:hypothetical protein